MDGAIYNDRSFLHENTKIEYTILFNQIIYTPLRNKNESVLYIKNKLINPKDDEVILFRPGYDSGQLFY